MQVTTSNCCDPSSSFLNRGFCRMTTCYNEAETLNYIIELLKSEKKTGVKR